MRDVSRRHVVKLAAGLAVGVGVVVSNKVLAQEAKPPADPELESALTSLGTFMFAELVTTKIDDTDRGRDLVITSATSEGRSTSISVRSRTAKIFRADAGVDKFTKNGGVHWQFGDAKGKTQFKKPGALVMVVHDGEGTIHWYSLTPDYRC